MADQSFILDTWGTTRCGTCDGYSPLTERLCRTVVAFGHRWLASGVRVIRARLMSLFGSWKLRPFVQSPKHRDLVALKELMASGKATPIIDRTYTLSETSQAVAHVGAGHAHGKVVISV